MFNQFLGGRYRVIQALGEGGFAKTYIAEDYHRPGHPKCVVKLLQPIDRNPNSLVTARRLFEREAVILEKLGKHAQIPRLLAHFEEKKEFYIVQEFIEGDTLNTKILSEYCWSESQAIELLRDVLPILEFLHRQGVIHRDLKPNNLIQRDLDRRLVLIDFGAVKEVSNSQILSNVLSQQNTIAIGTQGYMPMEQLQGQPSFNSDIYALGKIVIQALTGLSPIHLEEDRRGEVIWQNRAKVSRKLADIVTKMVRCHYKNRYRSATEVLKALNSLPNNRHDRQIPLTKRVSPRFTSDTATRKTIVPLNSSPWIPWDKPAVIKTKKKITLDTKQPTIQVPRKSEPITIAVSRHFQEKDNSNSVGLDIIFKLFKNKKLPDTSFFARLTQSRLLIGAGIATIFFGILGAYGYFNHKKYYLLAENALQQIEELKATNNYSECIEQAETFPSHFASLNIQVAAILLECQQGEARQQLTEAKQLAEQSKLAQAIALAAKIPQENGLYDEAQQLIVEWSQKIWQIATNKYQEGQLDTAKAIAFAIPATSPLANQVPTKIQQWDEQWQQNQTQLQVAQTRLNERRWRDAINAAQKVSHNNYQQQQSQKIIQKAQSKIAALQAITKKQDRSRPQSVPRTNSIPLLFRPKLRPQITPVAPTKTNPPRSLMAPGSRAKSFVCLNNPNPKCRK